MRLELPNTLGLNVSHGVVVAWSNLDGQEDGPCVITLATVSRQTIVTGVGETPGDALSQDFEHMLPPTSSEYLEPDEGLPDHDQLPDEDR